MPEWPPRRSPSGDPFTELREAWERIRGQFGGGGGGGGGPSRFGPFLVLRTREPVVLPETYLYLSARALLVGRSLGIGDSDINLRTVVLAARELRGYGPSLRSRSSNSR